MAKKQVLGTFAHERSTKNFEVYVRTNDQNRKESQYVPKSSFNGETVPSKVTLVVEF